MSLALITPSYIGSSERIGFASRSLKSLTDAIDGHYPLIVVDDVPRGKGRVKRFIPQWRYLIHAYRIYRAPHIRLIRQFGRSSRAATLRAVQVARQQGCDLVFLHLDDNVYLPYMDTLLRHTIHAFQQDAELSCVHLTGYPILSKACTPEQGNLTGIRVEQDRVTFDSVSLQPTRYEDYTLWWSYLHPDMVDGGYWPFTMWFIVYRADLLEQLLTFDKVTHIRGLNEVELYYKDKTNWQQALAHFSGKVGYVNMQFGGLEMQRNKNWDDLIYLPNQAVR
jgi:hypothetical protein